MAELVTGGNGGTVTGRWTVRIRVQPDGTGAVEVHAFRYGPAGDVTWLPIDGLRFDSADEARAFLRSRGYVGDATLNVGRVARYASVLAEVMGEARETLGLDRGDVRDRYRVASRFLRADLRASRLISDRILWQSGTGPACQAAANRVLDLAFELVSMAPWVTEDAVAA